MLVAASQLAKDSSTTRPTRPSSLPPSAAAAAPGGWTAAQRIYVLATTVALSIMATAICLLARDRQCNVGPGHVVRRQRDARAAPSPDLLVQPGTRW